MRANHKSLVLFWLIALALPLLSISQAQGGNFANPQFAYNFDESNVTERLTQIIELGKQPPGKPQYQSLDLARYLEAEGGRRGVFLLRAESWDPARK